MSVLSALVEEARVRYSETSKQNVTIYSVDSVTSNFFCFSFFPITLTVMSSRTMAQGQCGIMSRPNSVALSIHSYWRKASSNLSLATLMSSSIWRSGTLTLGYRIAEGIYYTVLPEQARVGICPTIWGVSLVYVLFCSIHSLCCSKSSFLAVRSNMSN
jgi:hypothetical protein